MSATQRKRLQRQRDKALGWAEISLKVPADRIEEVRAFAASLGEPATPTNPDQLSLLDAIDRALAGLSPDAPAARDEDSQGALF